jgi:N-acetylglutamate synthase
VSALGPRDIGHRVVVRHRITGDPGGKPLTDVLGVLQSLDHYTLAVRRADASVETVRLAEVTAAKRIPPMPLRPVDVAQLPLVAALGRPAAETSYVGEWLLRASEGWTGRANSVLPTGDPGRPAEQAVRAAVEFYTARGLPPLAQVVLGGEADGLFRGAGWTDARPDDLDTAVLHASLELLNADPGAEVTVADGPDEEWYDVAFGGGTPPAVARVVLTGAPLAGFAGIRQDGRPVAVARGAITGHWLGVDSVAVDPAYRRRGLGTAVVRGLARWAGGHGARRSYLEVELDNEPALTAYTRLGYAEAYRYRYLTPDAQ